MPNTQIEQSRQEKYLKLLLKLKDQLLNQKKEVFILKDFISSSRVDSSFFDACIKIGLITKCKNRKFLYEWNVEEPSIDDAEFCFELICDSVKKSQEKEYSYFNQNVLINFKK